MPDPRVEKLAALLVNYSLQLQPRQKFFISAPPLADELTVAVYAEALKAGAFVDVVEFAPRVGRGNPALTEAFYKYASDEQLDFSSPVQELMYTTYDAHLRVLAPANTRFLTNVDPARQARASRAGNATGRAFFERSARGELRWCLTIHPTQASAQDADMSFGDFQDFVYGAGYLDEPDPVARWRAEAKHQRKLIKWLAGKDRVTLKGANIDLEMSISGRTFEECAGRVNFPDGEIFTGPVEDTVSGWVRFDYPVIYLGHEVIGAELWFEDGRVVKESAEKGLDFLTATLNSDAGSRYLGEWGIGTNYNITHFTKNILFDEKIGGTIHLALGNSYPETGGKNVSAVHWDMICGMADSEVTIDGEVFYRDGRPVV